jgi:hypothetical protein
MKTFIVASTIALSACTITPAYPTAAYVQPIPAPVGVVYVHPVYAAPAPGYYWAYHPHYGYGYYNPRFGWYHR